MNYDEMLIKAKQQQLNKETIDQIAKKLELEPEDSEAYILLLILGYSNAIEYRSLVEKILMDENDPLNTRVALQVLCFYWGFVKDYSDMIKKFVNGVDWDIDGDAMNAAISLASIYLRNYEDLELFSLIYNIYIDKNRDDNIRRWAYEALARAIGFEIKEIIIDIKKQDPLSNPNPNVIAKIQNRLKMR